jgi:hypothetical protein
LLHTRYVCVAKGRQLASIHNFLRVFLSEEVRRMERIERTEIFGRHVISAIARSAPGGGPRRMWEVDVAAMALGGGLDTPLVRFSPPRRAQGGDPSGAIEAALEEARRELRTA